ncbi:MAG: hypothetical protein AAF961_16175 [Planctomycetota bacterium]
MSNIGQSVDRAQIATSILRPSQQLPPQRQAWTMMTFDGQVHAGLQLDHIAAGAIELFTTEGVTRRFEAKKIDFYEATNQSLMPDGLEQTMSVTEFQDLTAFLESLK